MSEHDDTDLIERIRGGLGELMVPDASPQSAISAGRRRRRNTRLFTGLAAIVLAVAVILPLTMLSGLRGTGTPVQGERPVPNSHCPAPVPSPAPAGGISCRVAVDTAWSVASFVQSADDASVRSHAYGVAEGHSVPAWLVTFEGARFVAGRAGCIASGTLHRYTVVLTVVGGKTLAADTPPSGCEVKEAFIQRPLNEVIELPVLPARGIVSQWSQDQFGVDLSTMSGKAIYRLIGFTIENAEARPGVVLLAKGSTIYRLLTREHRLVPLGGQPANYDTPPPRLPQPTGASGSWAWSFPAPSGSALLAQWSEQDGECRSPLAFTLPARDATPSSVTGSTPSLRDAPRSVGLGWSANGLPVVSIGGPCSSNHYPEGVYVVAAPGNLHPIPSPAGSYYWRMWQPVAA